MTIAAVAVAVAFALMAIVPDGTLAAFFSHDLLAQRAGVDVRASSAESARLFRAACAAAAVAWITAIPVLRMIAGRAQRASSADRSGTSSGTHRAIDARAPAAGAATPRRTELRWWIAVLACAATAGLAQRADILAQSLWFDEIAAFLDYSQWGVGASMGTYFSLANHPFHSMAVAAAINSTGIVSELVLRLPSVLAGLLTVPACAWLAWECARGPDRSEGSRATRASEPSATVPVTGAAPIAAPGAPPGAPRIAILAAIAALLMPLAILASTESRGYSMMILFAAVASAAQLRAMRGTAEGKPLWWLAYSGACALGCWTHPTFVALPLAHGAVATWRLVMPPSPRNGQPPSTASTAARAPTAALANLAALLLAAITTAALTIPLLPDVLRVILEFKAADGDEPTAIGIEGVLLMLQTCGAWVPWAAGAGAMVVVPGAARAWSSGGAMRMAVWLPMLAAALLAVGSLLAGSWIYARFALFTVPATAVAAALGVELWLNQPRRALAVGLPLTVALAWSASILALGPRQPIRDAVEWVAQRRTQGQAVASAGLADNVTAMYASVLDGDRASPDSIRSAGLGGTQLSGLAPTPDYLIVLYPALFERSGGAAQAKQLGLSQVRSFPGWIDRDQGEVRVYARPQPGP
ncbi:MAG: hypothetical protein FGM37_03920 [Phycisphaerales bacterium]|nr:hypothetical protein [Phycisphaerales bacterium]